MNKKLSLFLILGLVLIPTVLAFSPGDIIDFLGKGAQGSTPTEIIAYLRIIFTVVIGVITYSLLKLTKSPDNISLPLAIFFALIGGFFAPAKLLLIATSTYNVVIWVFLLAIPIIIVGALFMLIPGTNNLLRIIRLGLSFLLLGTIIIVKKGFEEITMGSTRFTKIPFIESFINWALWIIAIAISIQLGLLIYHWGKSKEGTSPASPDGTTTSSQPSAGPSPQGHSSTDRNFQPLSRSVDEPLQQVFQHIIDEKFNEYEEGYKKYVDTMMGKGSDDIKDLSKKSNQKEKADSPEEKAVLTSEMGKDLVRIADVFKEFQEAMHQDQQYRAKIANQMFNLLKNGNLNSEAKEKIERYYQIQRGIYDKRQQALQIAEKAETQVKEQTANLHNNQPTDIRPIEAEWEEVKETEEKVDDLEKKEKEEKKELLKIFEEIQKEQQETPKKSIRIGIENAAELFRGGDKVVPIVKAFYNGDLDATPSDEENIYWITLHKGTGVSESSRYFISKFFTLINYIPNQQRNFEVKTPAKVKFNPSTNSFEYPPLNRGEIEFK